MAAPVPIAHDDLPLRLGAAQLTWSLLVLMGAIASPFLDREEAGGLFPRSLVGGAWMIWFAAWIYLGLTALVHSRLGWQLRHPAGGLVRFDWRPVVANLIVACCAAWIWRLGARSASLLAGMDGILAVLGTASVLSLVLWAAVAWSVRRRGYADDDLIPTRGEMARWWQLTASLAVALTILLVEWGGS